MTTVGRCREACALLAVWFAASLASVTQAADAPAIELVGRDPAGHGLVARLQQKTVVIMSGTPEQMGAAHGRLLSEKARHLVNQVVYVVGAADTLRTSRWFFDRMAEIERRAGPHVPQRFFAECDALADASGVSRRDARCANLFPELFHCSGVAVRGKATRDGRVLHARVLDYLRDIQLQNGAVVAVFLPDGYHAWMSLGYAGFVGTVTAMNEKGLAIGEMGGRGEGDWDGMPMSFLLRDVMERAASVDEALAIIRQTPRTCEYYYVLSDKSRNMAALECRPNEVTVLLPGQQHARLPRVPEDCVLISAGDRAQALSRRVQEHYGRIDVPALIEIIKRPVAMNSNLHNAIFAPETGQMWVADAGKKTPACDEPYTCCDMAELLTFYRKTMHAERP